MKGGRKMNEFKERLKEAMELRDIKAIELADKVGIARGTISRYLSGVMAPKSKRVYGIAKALNVNPAWLIGYDVPMEEPQEHPEMVSSIQQMFDQLNIDEQKMLMTMLAALVDRKDGDK